MNFGERNGEHFLLPDYKPAYSSLRLSTMNKASGSLSKPDEQKNHKEVQLSLTQNADSSNAVASSSANLAHDEDKVPGDPHNGLGKHIVKSPEIRSPVSRVSFENSVSCISLMQSPPMQVMERPGDYDPNRIPSSVYGRPSLEWSVASNDSLFSIRIGKNSLVTDLKTVDLYASGELQLQRSGELVKNGEEVSQFVDFSKGDVKSSGIDNRNLQTPSGLKGMETHQNLNAVNAANGSTIIPGERRATVAKPVGNVPKALGNNKIIACIETPSSSIPDSRSENTPQESSLLKKNKSSCPLQAICYLQKNLLCCSSWKCVQCPRTCPSCKCICWLDKSQCCKCFKWSRNKPSCSWWPCKCSSCIFHCSSCKWFHSSSRNCFHCSSCKLSCFSSCDWSFCSCNCFSSIRKLCQPSCSFKWCRDCWSCQCCFAKWLNCNCFSCCTKWPSFRCCCTKWLSFRCCCTKWLSFQNCCNKQPICRCKPPSFTSCC